MNPHNAHIVRFYYLYGLTEKTLIMGKSLSLQSLNDLRQGQGTFGDAILAAKEGYNVARTGWNGAGMFAYIVPANSYPAQTESAKKYWSEKATITGQGNPKNPMVPYRAYWALKTAQDDVATWAPSGSDSLAEDWTIVE